MKQDDKWLLYLSEIRAKYESQLAAKDAQIARLKVLLDKIEAITDMIDAFKNPKSVKKSI